ncbi:MAG: hypothetical protein AAF420_02180, partial [Pseudomonadota bacterium]
MFDERVARAIVFVCVLLGAPGCATPPHADSPTFALGFTEAVFGFGIDPAEQHPAVRRDRVIRWDASKPVSVILVGEDIASTTGQEILQRLQSIYSLAGIELLDHTRAGVGTLKFLINNSDAVRVNGFLVPCYASILKETKGLIEYAEIVVVRAEIESSHSRCIEHEAMHTLGFGGHPHRLDSLLSYTQYQQDIRYTDRHMVEFLYSDAVRPGMSAAQAASRFYASLPHKRKVIRKRYTPQDISLEIVEDESPLRLKYAWMKDARKRITYERNVQGGSTVSVDYAGKGSNDAFANMTHMRLSTDHIFPRQLKLEKYVENLQEVLGDVDIREEGKATHVW